MHASGASAQHACLKLLTQLILLRVSFPTLGCMFAPQVLAGFGAGSGGGSGGGSGVGSRGGFGAGSGV